MVKSIKSHEEQPRKPTSITGTDAVNLPLISEILSVRKSEKKMIDNNQPILNIKQLLTQIFCDHHIVLPVYLIGNLLKKDLRMNQ